MRNLMRWVAGILLSSSFFAVQLAAQSGTGSIVGTVQDSAGAVLVSARVILEPSGRQAASDNQGQFRIANLAAGEYTLTTSYVGFLPLTSKVTVTAGQIANSVVVLQVASAADSVMVTAERLQGDAEAVNIERISDEIVQVLPATVITSLPNTNIADAVGRLPSVSLERDEGEGKYVQVRSTQPRLTNVTINGVNVPAPEVTVRNIKLDAVPSTIVERIEVFKTLSADQDGDGIGGTVNLVTKTAVERPTYNLNTTVGYNPLQEGFWRGGFDATYGQRFFNKRFGALLGGTYDKTNRGIDDLEPGPTPGVDPNTGANFAYFSTADLRSYDYYRTRYGFDTGIDYKFSPSLTVFAKGLYGDFHDYGDTNVYTPNTGAVTNVSGNTVTFDNTGSYQYRHYVRRPDQQVFSFQVGARQEFSKDLINYDFAVSRGHNIGGQDFPTTNFNGASAVTFTQDLSNPRRPKFNATDGSSLFEPTQYGVVKTTSNSYHATQLNIQGDVSLGHTFTIKSYPDTFSLGFKGRNSHSNQSQTDGIYTVPGTSPFTLADVIGSYKNPTYYNGSFAVNGVDYGPTSSYPKIIQKVQANQGAFTLDGVTSFKRAELAFFNSDERIFAGYLENVIFIKKLRIQAGLRVEDTNTQFLTNQLTVVPVDTTHPYGYQVDPTRQSSDYISVLPSVQVQYQLPKDTNLRLVYGRGQSRPNLIDEVPITQVDPNTTPRSIQRGNPNLVSTKANNYDVLLEHYFQPLGVIQVGYFYKQLSDPIYTTIQNITFEGLPYRQNSAINGPSAHIQGLELNWEQRFSFLPSIASGLGVSANYSYTESKVKFPAGFNHDRSDTPSLARQAPNNWNFNLTYDKSRLSSRFAISHNDASIESYQWDTSNGPVNDPILGLKGPLGDNYFYAHTQFDVQGSYRIFKSMEFVASGLNLSNEVFGFYFGSEKYPNQREYYRPTYSFGLRWTPVHEK